MKRSPFLLAALVPLAACSGSAESEQPGEDPSVSAMREQFAAARDEINAERALAMPAVVDAAEGVAANPVVTLAALGGAPELQPLGAVIAVDLGPTSGACTFDYRGATWLIAGAVDQPEARGRGAIMVAGLQRGLDGVAAGGPASITDGPMMSDGELTVEVRRENGEGAEAEGAVRWPAELVVRHPTQGERAYGPGTWTCDT